MDFGDPPTGIFDPIEEMLDVAPAGRQEFLLLRLGQGADPINLVNTPRHADLQLAMGPGIPTAISEHRLEELLLDPGQGGPIHELLAFFQDQPLLLRLVHIVVLALGDLGGGNDRERRDDQKQPGGMTDRDHGHLLLRAIEPGTATRGADPGSAGFAARYSTVRTRACLAPGTILTRSAPRASGFGRAPRASSRSGSPP